MNDYWGCDFFSFFIVLFKRSFHLVTLDLVADEVQLLALWLISMACSLIGTFLVYRKMTMTANSISHTILVGIAITYLCMQPFNQDGYFYLTFTNLIFASVITSFITLIATQCFIRFLKVSEDASIGLIFTALFAIGITVVTVFTRNAHIGVELIMGNVDALHFDDILMCALLFLANVVTIVGLLPRLKMSTFDPIFSKSIGYKCQLENFMLLLLTTATIMVAFRAVGLILVLAFLVGPTLIVQMFQKSFNVTLALSVFFSVLLSTCGVALSRHILSKANLSVSTAGLIVTLIALCYILIATMKKFRRLFWQKKNALPSLDPQDPLDVKL